MAQLASSLLGLEPRTWLALVSCVAPVVVGCAREVRVHVSSDEVARFAARPDERVVLRTESGTLRDVEVVAIETDAGERILEGRPATIDGALRELGHGGATLVMREKDFGTDSFSFAGFVLGTSGGVLTSASGCSAGGGALLLGLSKMGPQASGGLGGEKFFRATGTLALTGLAVLGAGILLGVTSHLVFLSGGGSRGEARIVRVGPKQTEPR